MFGKILKLNEDKVREILIVDDMRPDLQYMGKLIETFGYKTHLAESAKSALEILNDDIDLVIADGIMPEMNGFELVHSIKNNPDTAHIPVIMVTSLSGKDDRIKAIQSGVTDFVTKPVDQLELKVRIHSMLEMKLAQDEVRQYQKHLEELVAQKTKDLSRTLQKLQAVLNGMTDCVITLDDSLKIIEVNKAFEEISRLSNSELCGLEFENLLTNETQFDEFNSLFKMDKEFSSKDIELHQWGNKTYSVVVTYMKQGGYILVMRDITAKKKADEQKARFLSLLSHELRTPLNGINGLSEVMIEEKDSFTEDNYEFLVMINDCGKQMEKIVEELLNFVQFYNNISNPEEDGTDIVKLIEALVPQFTERCVEKNITLDYSMHGGNYLVHGQAEHLTEVFKQIIENSIKFGTQDGKTDIIISADETGTMVKVKDNGVGIPEDCLDDVYDSFFQAEDYTIRSNEGLGLGLTIAKRIVEMYNGKIGIKSENGCGTEVTIEFPAASSSL